MKEKFWFVWNINGNAPRYKHSTLESATTEAERLAASVRYEAFYVLEAVSVSRTTPPPVETISLDFPRLDAPLEAEIFEEGEHVPST